MWGWGKLQLYIKLKQWPVFRWRSEQERTTTQSGSEQWYSRLTPPDIDPWPFGLSAKRVTTKPLLRTVKMPLTSHGDLLIPIKIWRPARVFIIFHPQYQFVLIFYILYLLPKFLHSSFVWYEPLLLAIVSSHTNCEDAI